MTDIKGMYFNIQRYCLHDGDGIRTTVFLKGCPLKCLWCHNSESQKKEPELMFYSSKCTLCGRCLSVCDSRKIIHDTLEIDRNVCTKCGKCIDICFNDANEICGKEASADEVFKVVQRDRIFYETSGGGMTISGGEPSYQSEFSLELLRLAKDDRIDSAIETCGVGDSEFFIKAHNLGAMFLFDIKAIDSDKHKKLTGADNSVIFTNLELLFSLKAKVVLRFPLIPNLNDSDEDIKLLCDFMKSHSGFYEYAEIMPYHNLGISKEQGLGRNPALTDTHWDTGTVYSDKWLEKFKSHGCDVKISK